MCFGAFNPLEEGKGGCPAGSSLAIASVCEAPAALLLAGVGRSSWRSLLLSFFHSPIHLFNRLLILRPNYDHINVSAINCIFAEQLTTFPAQNVHYRGVQIRLQGCVWSS